MTQKEAIRKFKDTRITVLSFDEYDRRHSTYGALDPLTALQEVVRRTGAGRKVLLFDAEGAKKCLRWAVSQPDVAIARITYKKAKQWALKNINW